MTKVSIKDIKPNPNNPRLVKDDKFKKLVESVKGFPDMLNVRPIVVNKDMIVLGGNMRLKAMKEAGYKEANIEIVDWTEEQQREFIIKDNIGYGEWDWNVIANEWDTDKLEEWGMNIPSFDSTEEIEDELQIDEEIKTDNQCPKCGYEF
jgi:ParB-like chromosome segregation protein Spo0J